MLNASAVVKKAKENKIAYVERFWSGQEGKGGQSRRLNASAVVKKAKENRIAYVERFWSGQRQSGIG